MSSKTTEAGQPRPGQRLFFALWPDDAVRAALHQASMDLLGKRIKRISQDNLHLTLAFAGTVTAPVRACLEAGAGKLRCPAFELSIDHAGHWPRPRIIWIGPTHTPPALWSLAGQLHALLGDCGLQSETRPYLPHITLARKVSKPPASAHIDAMHWSIRHFCLLESVSGARGVSYRRLVSWTLEQP